MAVRKYKNGMKSAAFGTLYQLLTLILGLIVPRLFLQTFGSEVNGLINSAGNIFSYFALVEAGVGTVAIQALYGPIGQDDKKSINEIMTATANYYNKAGFIYLLGVIIISIVYPLTVNTTLPKITVVLLVILIGAGGLINFWVQGKYMVLFQAEGKKYLISIVGMISYLASNAMRIILLLSGMDVIAIHVGYFLLGIVKMLFYYFYVKKNYKWLNLHEKPNKDALKQSNAVFFQEIMRMLCSNTDILVLTYVAGDLKAVSIYSIYLIIYSQIEQLYVNFFGSFHYVLGQKFKNDRENYMPMHKTYEVLSIIGSFSIYTIAFVLTTPFISVYAYGITDAKYVDAYLPFLFTFMHLLSASREASSRVINFAGHFKQMQWRAALETCLNLTVSIVLVKFIGIYGVLIGTIVAYLYRTNDIIIYANKKILKRNPWHTYKLWIQNMAVFALIALGFHFIPLHPSNFAYFFLIAIPVGISIVGVYLLEAWLTDKEAARQLWNLIRNVFTKFIPKRKKEIIK